MDTIHWQSNQHPGCRDFKHVPKEKLFGTLAIMLRDHSIRDIRVKCRRTEDATA